MQSCGVDGIETGLCLGERIDGGSRGERIDGGSRLENSRGWSASSGPKVDYSWVSQIIKKRQQLADHGCDATLSKYEELSLER
jgi:hypothetical protein